MPSADHPAHRLDVGLDPRFTDLAGKILAHGWALVGVFDPDEGSAEFVYTVGLHAECGNEYMIVGLPVAIGGGMLNTIGERVKHGWRHYEGEHVDWLLENKMRCRFMAMGAAHQAFQAQWFIDGPVCAVQVVWPDAAGLLPGEPGFDNGYAAMQRAPGSPL